jgi:hypothetical protein
MTEWHLARLNVGRLRAPIEHPDSVGFADNLDPVNAEAEAASGFVWDSVASFKAFTFMLTFPPPGQS